MDKALSVSKVAPNFWVIVDSTVHDFRVGVPVDILVVCASEVCQLSLPVVPPGEVEINVKAKLALPLLDGTDLVLLVGGLIGVKAVRWKVEVVLPKILLYLVLPKILLYCTYRVHGNINFGRVRRWLIALCAAEKREQQSYRLGQVHCVLYCVKGVFVS